MLQNLFDPLFSVGFFSKFAKMERNDHSYVIQYFYLKTPSAIDIKAELDYTLDACSFVPSAFDRTSYEDEDRTGRPNQVMTSEISKKTNKAVLDEHQLKV